MVCEDGAVAGGNAILDYDWQKIYELLSYETKACEDASHCSVMELSSDDVNPPSSV